MTFGILYTKYNTVLVQNLGHLHVFLELWAQFFRENLGTRRLAIKLEKALSLNLITCWEVNPLSAAVAILRQGYLPNIKQYCFSIESGIPQVRYHFFS